MVYLFLNAIVRVNFAWLLEILAQLSSWENIFGMVCCFRSPTAQLIIQQRGVASELTNVIPTAIPTTENLERDMMTHLPPGDNLGTTISSPQFSQALSMFWSALQSGQAGPVIRQFGLGSEAVNAATRGNIEEFVTALQSESKTEQEHQSQDDKSKKQSSDEKKDGDESMTTD